MSSDFPTTNLYNWTNSVLWGGFVLAEGGSLFPQRAKINTFVKEDRSIFTIISTNPYTSPPTDDGWTHGPAPGPWIWRTQYLYVADGANPDLSNNKFNFFNSDSSCNITGGGSGWVWPAAGNYSNPTRDALTNEDPLSDVQFPFLTFTVDGSGVYCLIIFDRSIMGSPWGDSWRGIYLLYTLDGTKSPSTTADWKWSLIDSPGNPDVFGLGAPLNGIGRPQSYQIKVINGSVYIAWTDVIIQTNECASTSHIKYAFCSDITVENPEWNVSIIPGSATTGLNLQMYVDNNIVILSYCDWDGVSGSELITGSPTWYDWIHSHGHLNGGFGNLILSYTLNGNSTFSPPQWVSETLTQLMVAPMREDGGWRFPFVISKQNDIGTGIVGGPEEGGFTMQVNKVVGFSPYQVGGGSFSQYQVYFVFFPQWTSEDASGGATNLPVISGSDGIIWLYNLNALAPEDSLYNWTVVYDASGPQGIPARIGSGIYNQYPIYQGDLFRLVSQRRANIPPRVYTLAPAFTYSEVFDATGGVPAIDERTVGKGLIMWWRASPPDWRFPDRYIMPDTSWNAISNVDPDVDLLNAMTPFGEVVYVDFSIADKKIWLGWSGCAQTGGFPEIPPDEADLDGVSVAWLNVPVMDAGQAGNF